MIDTSDLPKELIKELNLFSPCDLKIMALFEDEKILNLNELLVAYYRKYAEVKTRQYMMTTCYRMLKKGILKSAKSKGSYEIVEGVKCD